MVFSSLLFVFLFLALNLVSQAALRGVRQKNIAMLIFSMVFFSWAGPRYVVLLLLDTALCWFFALQIEKQPGRKKLHLTLCVALVLAVLGVFKYTGFLLGNLQGLFGWPPLIPEIVLPIGISFYTFQLISYVADVYRSEVEAQKKYWLLLLYASLFHQCIAGPIVRYRDVAHDIETRRVLPEEISRGVSRFTVGLAKKAVLANSVAVLADRWLPTAGGLSGIPTAGLWLGGLCYMLQIYLDFSAYSDMAIGMGLMCGFHYRENFNYPYIASSVTDFWRRWHISLSSFFRDYVYIPLGGNRCGRGRQLLNLFIVWGLTGLWHGASWNYVLWGLFGGGAAAAGMTVKISLKNNIFLLAAAGLACTPLATGLWQRWKATERPLLRGAAAVWEVIHPVVLLLLSAMALAGDSYNPFLYFQF